MVVLMKSLLQEFKPSANYVAREESESVGHFVKIGPILKRFAQLLQNPQVCVFPKHQAHLRPSLGLTGWLDVAQQNPLMFV